MFPLQLQGLGERLCRYVPTVALGIDVGRSAIRVAVLRGSPQGVELAGLAAARLAADRSVGPDTAVVRDVVRRACRRTTFWPRRVAMAVGAGGVLARTVQVAGNADEEEIAESVERAARQLPVSVTDLRLTWATSEPVSEEGTLPRSVLMVAARREAVLARQHLAARAGLGPVVVDVDVFAGLRAVGTMRPLGETPGRPFLLVDAGHDSVRAAAVDGGGLPLFRLLPVPPTCTPGELAGVIAEAVQGLVPGEAVSPPVLLLSGGRAGAAGLAALVAERTGMPCRLAEPFAGLIDRQGLALVAGAVATEWPCAVGLARRALA